MRILILGSRGMAGHVIDRYLSAATTWEVWGAARGIPDGQRQIALDLRDTAALRATLARVRPDVVVNAAGILNEQASRSREDSIYINSLLPHLLAKYGSELSFRLIHISTDCVFSGHKGNYSENDPADGLTDYAKTKSLGEVTTAPHLTIRTSIIGPELKENGIGLFHWFMRQTGDIQGYTRVWWNGVTTLELAKAAEWCILHPSHGLVHLTAPDTVSKYQLLLLLQQHFDKYDAVIHPFDGLQSDKSLRSTRSDFTYRSADYPAMFRELRAWMDNSEEAYEY